MNIPNKNSFYRFTIGIVILFSSVQCIAQWKNIAPNIVTIPPIINGRFFNNFGGAIAYNNRVIVAAYSGTPICISSDDGKSWQVIPSPYSDSCDVCDVDIYGNNILISVNQQDIRQTGLYLSQDGGMTWKQPGLGIKPLPGAWVLSAKFVGDPNVIVAMSDIMRVCLSSDMGVTWNQIATSGANIQVSKIDNSIHVFNLGNSFFPGGHILSTRDFGKSWDTGGRISQLNGGRIPGLLDCYQFAIGSCGYYVMNESTVTPAPDNMGHIFTSNDKGTSFAMLNPHDPEYYCGSIITAPGGTVFVQTKTSDGVLRSIDHGLTWQSIGGPPGFRDSHLICCKDDNTVFALDTLGNIWETTNSGGNPINVSALGLLSGMPFSFRKIQDTITPVGIILPIILSSVSSIPDTKIRVNADPSVIDVLNVTSAGQAINFTKNASGSFTMNITSQNIASGIEIDWLFNTTSPIVTSAIITVDSETIGSNLLFCDNIAQTFTLNIPCGEKSIFESMRENKISDFTIHPNPAENFFVIESTAKTTYASVEIFDQLGRSLLRRNAVDFTKDNKVTLDISGLSSGMYYLRVEANGFTRSQEVVVSH